MQGTYVHSLPPHLDPGPAEGSQGTRGREQQDVEGTGSSAAGKILYLST